MKLKEIPKEELETMSFDDIAYIILKEKGKKMKTADIFKLICTSLDLGENAYTEQIGDFFTLLSTEKRFIQLDKGYWDLRENHKIEVDLSEAEEDEEDLENTEETDEVSDLSMEDDMFIDETKESDDDEEDDDLQDLVIMDEENETDL